MIDIFRGKPCWICGTKTILDYSWASLSIKPIKIHLCNQCKSKLQLLAEPRCCKCSRMLSELEPDYIYDNLCSDCYRWEQDDRWKNILDQNISLYKYNTFLQELLALFKYRGDYAIAEIFAEDIRSVISKLKVDYVVPIPLSSERLLERGFNQSEALLRVAGVTPSLILTRIHTEKQSKKSRQQRLELQSIFLSADKKDLTDKQILLVDDIYTTGSTLRHAAKVLKEIGAQNIYSLTIAR
ncbi:MULTISPECIES: ComF family protein [Bacillus]|uniref:ComF family protein n=1 Tax=Bacillus TaxID=1386 RepID=UPI0002DD7A97|nr:MULTISPECIES: ComF family protein [Bacillus]